MKIDPGLRSAGWIIQNRVEMNASAGSGVTFREVPMSDGRVDYLLNVNQKIVGVIDAKPAGTTLAEVHLQTVVKEIQAVLLTLNHGLISKEK